MMFDVLMDVGDVFVFESLTPFVYALSLHDALPISFTRPAAIGRSSLLPRERRPAAGAWARHPTGRRRAASVPARDRKSTRLNSSHRCISYAVFCLKKKSGKSGTHIRK